MLFLVYVLGSGARSKITKYDWREQNCKRAWASLINEVTSNASSRNEGAQVYDEEEQETCQCGERSCKLKALKLNVRLKKCSNVACTSGVVHATFEHFLRRTFDFKALSVQVCSPHWHFSCSCSSPS